jgi:hypothetical protein
MAVVNIMFTSSAGTLGSSSPAFQPLFSPQPLHDTLYFDEGPRLANHKTYVTSSASGSMDTSAVDAFVQGVEITRQAQYDAGLAKIWSGDAGHVLKPCVFGQDKNFFPDPGFADLELFNPVALLRAEESLSPLYYNILTYPIITGDNDQAENFNFNGIIEPLTIRPIVAFFSIEAPFEAHTVRGAFGNGNIDQINGGDVVETISNFEPTQQIVGYLDMVDIINAEVVQTGSWASGSWTGGVPNSGSYVGSGDYTPSFVQKGTPLTGFFRYEFTARLPFADERHVRNTEHPEEPVDIDDPQSMVAALSLMTGSTDNYIRYNQRSAPCGWYYDNNGHLGTDSIAFGGMIY